MSLINWVKNKFEKSGDESKKTTHNEDDNIQMVEFSSDLHIGNKYTTTDEDDSSNRSYVGAGMSNRGSRLVTNEDGYDFETQRKMTESKIVSEWPHTQREDVPLLGPDEFAQWFSPPPVFLWYMIAQFAACFIFSFVVSAITVKFPVTNPDNTWIRSSTIGAAAAFVQFLFGETTGGFLDIYLLWLVVVSNMFFSRRYGEGPGNMCARLTVIGKGVFLTIASVAGYFAGPALTATKMGGHVFTSNCTQDFQILCLARPSVNYVNDTQATFMTFLGHLLVQTAVFFAWTVVKRRTLWVQLLTKSHVHQSEEGRFNSADGFDTQQKQQQQQQDIKKKAKKHVAWRINDNWITVSFIIGGAYMLSNMMDSSSVGSGPDTLYWLVTATYTNDFSEAKVYAFVGLIAGIIVFLGRLLYHLLVTSTVYYRTNAIASANYHLL